MSLHMTEEEYQALLNRRSASSPAPYIRRDDPKRSKYGNKRTEVDGETFDSAHEAQVWKALRAELTAGAYNGVARQVRFGLPGGVAYVADFVTLNKDGSYTVIDAKSAATKNNAVYKLKKKQMLNCLGLEIKEL